MNKRALEQNIKKIFWLNASFCFFILMPIIVPFFQSRGLNMAQIYQLQAIFAFFVLVCEVPSGYFSDLFGRKISLMVSSSFHCIGFLLMAISPEFWGMVVAEVFLGIAVSLFSGTDLSLLYDSLQLLNKEKGAIKKVGQCVYYRQIGESFAGLIGGWLILYHFEAPAWAQAIVGLAPLIVASTLYEPPRKKMDAKKTRENISYIYKSLFGQTALLRLIILNGVFYNFATLVAVWSFQKYWQDVGIPLYFFGYLWFLINITVGITARYAHKFEKRWGSEWVLLVVGIFPVLGFFGMSVVTATWGVLFCLFFQVVRGLNAVVIRDALNKRVNSDMRATANSIMGLGTRILMIGVGPLIGWLIDQNGNAYAQEFLGYLYLVVFLLVLLPLLSLRKQYQAIS